MFEIIWILNCFSSWNLNVPTKDVRFCQWEFECLQKECKFLSFLELFQYQTELSSSVGIEISPQRMLVSFIFVIISILNCLFSWGLNLPSKDVKFCNL